MAFDATNSLIYFFIFLLSKCSANAEQKILIIVRSL
jgi:hypothetical protein